MPTDQVQLARDILSNSTQIEGCVVRLTCGQLSRPEYVAVNKALESMGGKWNRKQAAHIFSTPPAEAIAAFISGAAMAKPPRTSEGYVPTPAELAAQIVNDHTVIDELEDGAAVLEPSAGDGAFVRAILAVNPTLAITAVEPNTARLDLINVSADAGLTRVNGTLEEFAATTTTRYLAVVMNPPFAVPKSPSIWIDHVRLAYGLLAPGGRVTAIVPISLLQRQDRRHSGIRDLMKEHGGYALLDEQAFKTSGTGVRTAVMWLDADS
ncbi:methyltransferase [Mycobacteroides abscessus]|uniref:methyltransferase n=1 Tax=Mycobacteroides abscessus TaxID=36809 RepID=UPI0021030E8B|nr:methyltransferase [Mycobacteroides abscessus]